MKKFYVILNLILIALFGLSPFIPNIFSLILLAITTITLFAIRKKFGFFIIVSYLVLLPTIIFKMSVHYDFVYKIEVSLSYALLTDGIAVLSLLIYFLSNLLQKNERNRYVYRG